MTISFWNIGDKPKGEYKALIEKYRTLCSRYQPLDFQVIDNSKIRRTDIAVIQREEEQLVRKKLKSHRSKYRLILLDEKGKNMGSKGFAQLIQEHNAYYPGIGLLFLAGGAFGFSEALKKEADLLLSFSKMTFPHDLFRVIFLEQLFRAFTIIANEKYHND
jgi:23S rRNA (pseudouridine1915-N3)-methyltransferase